MIPLFDAQAQYDAELQTKIQRFLGLWLPEVETRLDDKGLQANMYVIFEEPFTPGGPFAQVPKAVVTAQVVYKGTAYPSEETRRGLTLGIQSMQTWPDPATAAARIERMLVWSARPESFFFPKA